MAASYSPAVSTASLPHPGYGTKQQTPTGLGGPSNSASRRPSSRFTPSNTNGYTTSPLTSTSVNDLGLPRRQSRLSTRQNSNVSVSGASTPGTKRRVFGKIQEGDEVGERDWARMEPDEIFRRLPVGEVKKVEAKMRCVSQSG